MARVLYVDDSPTLLLLRAATLRLAGFDVIACATASEGLARLATSCMDVVVTDYEMPELDGFAFADHARANGCRVPIVMCTGSIDLPKRPSRSVDCIVSKGEVPRVLIDALNVCLHRDAQLASKRGGLVRFC